MVEYIARNIEMLKIQQKTGFVFTEVTLVDTSWCLRGMLVEIFEEHWPGGSLSRLFPQSLRLEWKVIFSRCYFQLPAQQEAWIPGTASFTTLTLLTLLQVNHRAGHYYISIVCAMKTFSVQWMLLEQSPPTYQTLLTLVERPTGIGEPM